METPELQIGKQDIQIGRQENEALGLTYQTKKRICDNFWSRLRELNRKMR